MLLFQPERGWLDTVCKTRMNLLYVEMSKVSYSTCILVQITELTSKQY